MSKLKMVLKVDVHTEKEKQKAMKAVSSLYGIDSLAMDMKEKKLTVIGDVDPVDVVCKLKKNCYTSILTCKLKKNCYTSILTVGPAKEPEKKDKNNDEDKCDELRKLCWGQYYPYYGQYNPWCTKY